MKDCNKEIVKCTICDKNITVKYGTDGKIKNKLFHTKLHKKYFDGWMYQMDVVTMETAKIEFKNTWYKIIGYTKVQRTVVYFIWKLFHKKTIDYWECSSCLKKR